MRVEGRDGHTYLTAGDVRHQHGYGDVTAAILRGWTAADHLHRVTVAELAAALGCTVPASVEADRPATARGPSGPEYVYRWADVVRCETARRIKRRTHGGRPRARAA